ncbi:MAG: DUF362 domain-containing protein [Nitrospirae bacterium]|nr:MAG: DUF362 domain-containing protein [Nitrospirota bacterium]
MSSSSYWGIRLTRRELLLATLASGALLGSGVSFLRWLIDSPLASATTFIGRADSYDADIRGIILRGLNELGVTATHLRGKRILLKPNLVETHEGAPHINTHPHVVRGAIEAFLSLGAESVVIGEGPGHRRDTLEVLEASGLGSLLYEDRIPFLNVNYETGIQVPNRGGQSRLSTLTFPRVVQDVDWIVSMAKLKTHHWAGATLAMKNLFGIMPGLYYGWPKNVLHQAGIPQTIVDITATLRPHLAIVDGIVGMEGDGPIMGTPVQVGAIIMGRNFPAVDATCCRIMGIDPYKIRYLRMADQWLGPIHEGQIEQRGELISTVQKPFALIDAIPAHRGIRLR